MVSGATYTSTGYRTSLQSALDQPDRDGAGVHGDRARDGDRRLADGQGRPHRRRRHGDRRGPRPPARRRARVSRPTAWTPTSRACATRASNSAARCARVAEVAERCRDLRLASGGRFDAHWQGWFDPTGYVKGWSVDAAAAAFDELLADGVVEAVGLNVGGDMRLRTAPGSDPAWTVGIAHPVHAASCSRRSRSSTGPSRPRAPPSARPPRRSAHRRAPRGPGQRDGAGGRPRHRRRVATVAAIAGVDDFAWMPAATVASGVVGSTVTSDASSGRRRGDGVPLRRGGLTALPAGARQTQREHRARR